MTREVECASQSRRTVYSARMPRGFETRHISTVGVAVAVIAAAAAVLVSRGWMPGVFDSMSAPRSISYFIAQGDSTAGYRESDRELAALALLAWQNASRGRLAFQPGDITSARILIQWTTAADAYGRTRQLVDEDGLPRATVQVRPDVSAMGPGFARVVRDDPLMREVMVYLTCVHESGHAIGLPHSDRFEDVMYDFALGGDIAAYFKRYRSQITTRDDIVRINVLSEGDRERLSKIR
jgi:hypothetical protein